MAGSTESSGFVICYRCLELVTPDGERCPVCGTVIHPLSRGITVAQFGNEQTRLRKEAGHPRLTEAAATRRRTWVEGPPKHPMGSAWQCPVCGTENGATVERCPRCGRTSPSPEEMAESKAGNTHRFSWGQFYAGIGLGIFVVYLLPGWIMLAVSTQSPDGRVEGAVGNAVFSTAWLLALGTLAYLLIKRRWEATTGLIVGVLGSGVFMLAMIGSGI